MGKQQHTPYSRHLTHLTPSDVTVTRRHHPLHGRQPEAVLGGAATVVVRLADGTTMRLPRTWTDADGPLSHEPGESVFSAALRLVTEGLIPEGYAPFAQRIFASLAQGLAAATTESDVAEAVWRAANDASGQLRFPAGADAVALAQSR